MSAGFAAAFGAKSGRCAAQPATVRRIAGRIAHSSLVIAFPPSRPVRVAFAILAAMHPLRCRLPASLWHALEARRRADGQSIDHIVRAALADYLQVDHSTLFQISSSV